MLLRKILCFLGMEIVALPSLLDALLDALLDPLLAPLLPYVFLLYMLFSISWPAFTVNEGPDYAVGFVS